ncbi:hypothetical protein [Alteromonas macleodii]|uniref:Transcriptional antiterminator n=1 Tax=Alteromonas macleodii TaxID=28108 RepID=A0A6T9Y685_ALTMA
MLAWLLLDMEARHSYNSIAQYQLNHGYIQGQYRRWNFRFDPPDLPGVTLDMRGNLDVDSRTMLIYEVSSVKNIATNIPESVDFLSARFFTQVHGEYGGTGRDAERPLSHSIYDLEEGSRENKPVMLSANATLFEFIKAVETSKISGRQKSADRGRRDNSEPDKASRDVSVEEQGPEGSLPSAE